MSPPARGRLRVVPERPPHPSLTGSTLWLLTEVRRRLRTEIEAELRSEYAMTWAGVVILLLVESLPDISQEAIADRTGLDRSTVSDTLFDLAGCRYLIRTPDRLDRRRLRSRITPDGSALAAATAASADAATRRTLARLQARERRRLDQLLGRALGADAELDQFGALRAPPLRPA